jgi:hypothetical protein
MSKMSSENIINPSENIRKIMLLEIKNDTIYIPKTTIFQNKIEEYKQSLKEHIKNKDLKNFILFLKKHIINWNGQQRNGSKISSDSHEKLGESEWNKYYMKAICKIAEKENKEIKIIRWKPVLEQKNKIGFTENTIFEPTKFYEKINKYPFGTNSGLTIKII